MNIYLKIFLRTCLAGIPFGIFMVILDSFQYGFRFPSSLLAGLQAGIFFGFFFGFFMSLTLSFHHNQSVKRIIKQMSLEESEEAYGVYHVRNIELRLPYDKAFDFCAESLNLIKRCKITKEDRSQGKIDARAGMTWDTWGDVISFEVRKIDSDRTQVIVSSKPLHGQLLDDGKNLKNIERTSSFLKEQSETAYNKR